MVAYRRCNRVISQLCGRQKRLILHKAESVLGLITRRNNKRSVWVTVYRGFDCLIPAAGVVYQNILIISVARAADLRIRYKDYGKFIGFLNLEALNLADNSVLCVSVIIGFALFKPRNACLVGFFKHESQL